MSHENGPKDDSASSSNKVKSESAGAARECADKDQELKALKSDASSLEKEKRQIIKECENRLARELVRNQEAIASLKAGFAEREKQYEARLKDLEAKAQPIVTIPRTAPQNTEAPSEPSRGFTPQPGRSGGQTEQADICVSFQQGLNNFEVIKRGGEMEVVSDACVKISRKDRRGSTYLLQRYEARPGAMIFTARIKAVDIKQGLKRYERGKFQAIIFDKNGRNLSEQNWYWPADDIGPGSIDWTNKTFQILDLDGTETIALRIGLQNASGSLYYDQIKIFYVQDNP